MQAIMITADEYEEIIHGGNASILDRRITQSDLTDMQSITITEDEYEEIIHGNTSILRRHGARSNLMRHIHDILGCLTVEIIKTDEKAQDIVMRIYCDLLDMWKERKCLECAYLLGLICEKMQDEQSMVYYWWWAYSKRGHFQSGHSIGMHFEKANRDTIPFLPVAVEISPVGLLETIATAGYKRSFKALADLAKTAENRNKYLMQLWQISYKPKHAVAIASLLENAGDYIAVASIMKPDAAIAYLSHKLPAASDQQQECNICCDGAGNVRQLYCAHELCTACILHVVSSAEKAPVCPFCRAKLYLS